jgi:hypothetical protein
VTADRKRRAGGPRHPRPGRSKPAKASTPEETATTLGCWLCARPLKPGDRTSLLGLGVFEVHRECYDRALGLDGAS